MEFFDRIGERARLAKFLERDEGALACLYGRRRIGKSRLLDEALKGRRDVVSYCADRSEPALQRARMAVDVSRMLPGFADAAYATWRAFFERWQRDAPRGSVLVVDEFPYLVEKSPELPSILQKTADGLRRSGQKVVICGSSQRMMQGLVLDESEPLYGRCRVIMKLGPLGFSWLKDAFPREKPIGHLRHYAVWGGVPRYWEVCQGERNFWETVRTEIFDPNGLFHDEPSFVLKDDLDGAAQASSVLALVAQGCARPSEMAARLELPQTALGRPLKRLMNLGLVRRDIPFGKDARSNKQTLYKLSDPFLRFWYAFALPHYSDAHFLETAADRKRIEPVFSVFLGEAWEQLVRDRVSERRIPGVGCRWCKVSRWWGTGLDRRPMEVDVVAESDDGKSLLLGECKLSLTARECEAELDNLRRKTAQLPFVRDYPKTHFRVFAAESPSPDALTLNWAMER